MNIWTNVVSSLVKSCDIKAHTITPSKPHRAKSETELLAERNRQRIIDEFAEVDFTKYDVADLLEVGLESAHRYIYYLKAKGLLRVVKDPAPGIAAVYRVIGNA